MSDWEERQYHAVLHLAPNLTIGLHSVILAVSISVYLVPGPALNILFCKIIAATHFSVHVRIKSDAHVEYIAEYLLCIKNSTDVTQCSRIYLVYNYCL